MLSFSKTCLFAVCIGLVGRSVAFSAIGGAVSSRLSSPGVFNCHRPRCVAKTLWMQERVSEEPTPIKPTESKPKSTADETNFYAKVGD